MADLGYGISQVLPVLAQCSFAQPGSTLLFEQPELHLHPLAAGELTGILCETVQRGITVVVETHSPELIRSLQSQVRKGKVSTDSVAVFKTTRSNGATMISRVEIESDGDVYELWERGISRRH